MPRGLDVRVGATVRARLVGLAALSCLPPGRGLLLPRTRSVHTCFMRFALDLLWLDREGRVVRVDRAVAPWRVRSCLDARSVVELRAGAPPAHDPAGLRFGSDCRGEHFPSPQARTPDGTE
jgi:uncharacterized membrane protein (UPF0127 family)